MDTNPIQSVNENTKLVATDDCTSLGVVERYFLQTTNAIGVWPVALMCAAISTGIVMGGIEISSLGLKAIGIYGFVGLSSSLFTASTWLVLSRFRWPIGLRLTLSIWTPFTAAVALLQPYFTLVNWTNFFQDPVAQMFIMPSIVGGFIALCPYLYREHLTSKLITGTKANPLIEESK